MSVHGLVEIPSVSDETKAETEPSTATYLLTNEHNNLQQIGERMGISNFALP